MIYQETNRTRRIVGRLDRGDDCVEALESFCRDHDIRAGEVRAVGQLRDVEVVRLEEEAGEYRTVFDGDGTFDLLHLSGNVATMQDEIVLRLESVLSAAGPVGEQLVTGQLRAGTVVDVEFVLESWDDLELERRLDGDTGRLELGAIRPRDVDDESESVAGQSMDWEDAAEAAPESGSSSSADSTTAASEPEGDEEESVDDIYGDLDFEEPVLDTGDVLDHPKLGRCRVMKLEDGEYAHVRLPRGKIRKLSLDVLELEFRDEDDSGRKVFEAQVSR